jgi:hypothetical protein
MSRVTQAHGRPLDLGREHLDERRPIGPAPASVADEPDGAEQVALDSERVELRASLIRVDPAQRWCPSAPCGGLWRPTPGCGPDTGGRLTPSLSKRGSPLPWRRNPPPCRMPPPVVAIPGVVLLRSFCIFNLGCGESGLVTPCVCGWRRSDRRPARIGPASRCDPAPRQLFGSCVQEHSTGGLRPAVEENQGNRSPRMSFRHRIARDQPRRIIQVQSLFRSPRHGQGHRPRPILTSFSLGLSHERSWRQ